MKYMGSKNRISNDLKLFFDLNRTSLDQYFVDLFCGGCNMSDKMKGKRIASDNNKYLIAMWKGIQNDLERPFSISRKMYDNAKHDFSNGTNNYYSDFLIGWIGFMASFNGKFYDAGYGGSTKTRDYTNEQIRNIERQKHLIKDIEFIHSDYRGVLIPDNSVVYCDIPYRKSTGYTTGKFNYDLFYDFAEEKSKQGHKVFISEYWMPKDRFRKIWSKKVNTNISTKTSEKIESLFIPKSQIINEPMTLF